MIQTLRSALPKTIVKRPFGWACGSPVRGFCDGVSRGGEHDESVRNRGRQPRRFLTLSQIRDTITMVGQTSLARMQRQPQILIKVGRQDRDQASQVVAVVVDQDEVIDVGPTLG